MLPVKNSLLPTVSKFFDDDWITLFDWTNNQSSGTRNNLPLTNIRETAEHYFIEMAVPGLKKDDFQIEVKDNVLSIRHEFNQNSEDPSAEYFRREFNFHSFERSFSLNEQVVNSTQIKAKYQDGILYLTIPKKEEAKQKPARVIKVL